jgi:hypothetical protein
MSNKTQLAVHTIPELVEMVPILLGFIPAESLVVVYIRPATNGRPGEQCSGSGSVHLVSRADLPTSTMEREIILDPTSSHAQGDHLVLIAYSDDPDGAVHELRDLHRRWRGGPIPGGDRRHRRRVPGDRGGRRTSADRWRRWSGDRRGGAGRHPTPAAGPARTRRHHHRTRPRPGPGDRREDRGHPVERISTGRGRHAHLAGREEDTGWPPTSDQDLLLLIASVQDIDVRDAAWACISTAEAQRHVDLWRQAATRVNGPLALPVLGLLGIADGIAGQGGLANVVLERAQSTEGSEAYSMLGLLAEILGRGVDPACWEALGPSGDDVGQAEVISGLDPEESR